MNNKNNICNHCGSELPQQAKFCCNCGKEIMNVSKTPLFDKVAALYDYVSEFIGDKAVCAKYNKYLNPPSWEAHFVDKNGIVLEERCDLDQAGDFYILNVRTLLNKQGKVVEEPQQEISYFSMKDGLNTLRKTKSKMGREENQGFSHLYGLLDMHTGRELLPVEYPDFEELTHSIVMVNKQGLSGVFNYQTGLSVPCCYDEITEYIDEEGKEYFIAKKKSADGTHDCYGVVDIHNKEIMGFVYESISELYGKGMLLKMNGYTGLADIQGRMHFPFKYSELESSGDDLCVKKGDYWGMVTIDDKVIIPFEYERPFYFCDNGLAAVYKGGKCGIIDRSNNIIIPFIFYSINETGSLKSERPQCVAYPTRQCQGWGRIFINERLDIRFDIGSEKSFYERYPEGHKWLLENKQYLGRIWKSFELYEEATPERFPLQA